MVSSFLHYLTINNIAIFGTGSTRGFVNRYDALLLATEYSHERSWNFRPGREANATAPIAIVAIAPLPPQALLREAPRSSSSARSAMMSSLTSSFQARPQQPHNDEALRHFNECLTVPVTGVEVSGLAQRWLLAPALPVMGGAMVASRAGGLGCFGRSTNSSVQLLGAPLSFPAQQTGRYGHNHRGALACLGAGMQASHPLSTARASILQQAQAATSTGLPPNGMIMMNMNGMMTAQDHDNCLTR